MKTRRALWIAFAFFILAEISALPVRAEYADQIKKQVSETEARSPQPDSAYFHDMGVIAKKADDAQLFQLLGDILRQNLFKKTDEYVEKLFARAEEIFESDPSSARGILNELNRFSGYYEPSAEFLGTAAGKATSAEFVRLRQDAIRGLTDAKAESNALIKGFQAYRKTGSFYTRTSAEEADLNELSRRLGCHLAWARTIRYAREQEFKTDYEEGIMKEEAELTLQTSADSLNAEWRGPWIFSFTGRDGIGKGASDATLKLKRGDYDADLMISRAQLSSTGRFNFPGGFANERRTVSISGTKMQPLAEISDSKVPLTGCEPEDEGPAEVKNKNGRVLAS